MSAAWSSSPAASPLSGLMAMPMLASTSSARPATTNGSFSASRTRSTIGSTALRSRTFGSRSANSSPPRRATVSPPRQSEPSRLAVRSITRSPLKCPRASLISLKRSRSSITTATQPSFSRASSAFSVMLLNTPRLGRPGERVVQRLVLLLGGLALEAAGSMGHDSHDCQRQKAEPGCEDEPELVPVARQGRRHRFVRRSDLERPMRRAARAGPQWDVGLHQPVGGARHVHHYRGAPALLRLANAGRSGAARGGQGAAEVQDLAARVPRPHARDVAFLAGRVRQLADAPGLGGADPLAQLLGGEAAKEGRRRGHCPLANAGQRAA